MKTFDIALKYLKDTYSKNILYPNEIAAMHEKFCADKDNTVSNEHYRSTVFMAAVYHNLALANNKISPFYIALEIIEAYNPLIKTDYERYMDTTYPKVMVDIFNDIELENIQDTEIKFGIFTSAYHYLID